MEEWVTKKCSNAYGQRQFGLEQLKNLGIFKGFWGVTMIMMNIKAK